MNRFLKVAIFTVLTPVSICVFSAESSILVDITSELTSRLSMKPGVRKERIIDAKETRCEHRRKVPCSTLGEIKSFSDFPILPEESDKGGGILMCYEPRCTTVIVRRPATVVEPLIATNNNILQVTEMKVQEAKVTQFPPKTFIKQVEKFNCSSTESSIDEGLSFNTQSTVSTSIRRGVRSTTSVNASVSFKLPSGFGSSVGGSISQSTSLDRSETQSTTTAINQTARVSEKVPPRTRTRVDVVLYETSLEVPFSGGVIVDGTLDANLDNLHKASEILSAQERTVQVEGILAVTASTLSQAKRIDRPVTDLECSEIAGGKLAAYAISDLNYVGTGTNTLTTTRKDRENTSINLEGGWRKKETKSLRNVTYGPSGNLCYIAPCNRPLDGYREFCYFDEEGSCSDCGDEIDAICEPDGTDDD